MIQFLYPGRTHKRIIYAAFVWTCVCFVVFRLSRNPHDVKNYEYLINSGANGGSISVIDTGGQRGLLQNNLPPDYSSASALSGFFPYSHLISATTTSYSSAVNSASNSNNHKFHHDNSNFNSENDDNNNINYIKGATNNGGQKRTQIKLQIDTSTSLSERDILNQLANVSNLPLAYWSKVRYKSHVKPVKSSLVPSLSIVPAAASSSSAVASSSSSSSSSVVNPSVDATVDQLSCRYEFPNLFDLEYNNVYWQQLRSSNGTFYFYGAYYDDRWRGGPLPVVRILAMIDRIKPPPLNCLLWFDGISGPIVSQASYTYGWYPKWGNYKDGLLQPWIITCKIPRIRGWPKKATFSSSSSYSSSSSGLPFPSINGPGQPSYAPDSVSLVENRCDKAHNNLRVINNRPPVKQDFAVCVKGLDFLHDDLSVRVIEWIELLKLLGAKKIFLYELEIHSNLSKVVQHYQREGIVELTPITLPGYQPNLPGFRHLYLKNKLTAKRQNELIPYNDCLYRNLYSYSYLALLDIDEVIMPLQHDDWPSLMKVVEQESLKEKNYSRASYNVRNVYFLDDLGVGERQMKHTGHEPGIPSYLHMLQHVYRSKNYTKPGQYVKCFHNTERVVSLHNHFPLNCFGSCTTYSVDPSLAHLQHYRKDCVGPLKDACKTDFRMYTTRDTTIWKYKDQLTENSNAVLKQLGFFENTDFTVIDER